MELLSKHKYFLLIAVFYLIFHLINLTLLPIFNDESIYLDWSWNAAHIPGRLYDSLTDAKQPLMLWIFGFFTNFFEDPLYAGRFASVLIGLTTLSGIYVLTKNLFNQKTALVASLLFSVTPLFVFYNRQALMEAGVVSAGIWICIALLRLLHTPTPKNGVILGVLFGIGFYIKTSSVLFILCALLIIAYMILRKKEQSLLAPTGWHLRALL
jgi:4-amino-4-deoxy-L-arabinose transferase-like glycosyltransferase